ncbi:hypothetical protein MHYP_G00139780 [Metynnis hypsauchen]
MSPLAHQFDQCLYYSYNLYPELHSCNQAPSIPFAHSCGHFPSNLYPVLYSSGGHLPARLASEQLSSPSTLLASQKSQQDKTSSQLSLSTEKEQPCPSHAKPDSPVSEEQPGPYASTENHATSRRRSTSQPSFYETYEARAERRTAALEPLVWPDLERWRRLKERRRRECEKKC